MITVYLKKHRGQPNEAAMTELTGQWLRSTGSGQRWLLIEVVQPGLILCKNEVQLRGNLPGVYYKALPQGGYDYAWQNQCSGAWDYAYSERSAALQWATEASPTRISIHTRRAIAKK